MNTIMKKLLFTFIVGMVAVMFVAACGAEENANVGNENGEENESGTASDEEGTADGANDANEDGAADEANDANEKEASAETMVVEHELGETEVVTNPEKIVVFDMGILDTMDELGVEPQGVPQPNLPSYLDHYDSEAYENVGTLFEPDFETIYGLEPDLIIISGRTADAYDELNDIAPTIHVAVDQTDYFSSFTANMELLGELFDRSAEVDEKLAEIEEQKERIQEQAAALDVEGLILMTNEGELSVYGPGSRYGLIHDDLGIQAADEEIDEATHGQNVSFEYVLDIDPDYLFVLDRGAVVSEGDDESAEETLDNALIHETSAYQNGRIISLDPEYWYIAGGGLNSVAGMLDDLEDALVE